MMQRFIMRKEQYRLAAAMALAVALLLVWPLELVLEGNLPLWLHLPLAGLLLGVFSLAALGAGVAYVHYRTGPYRD